MSVWQQFAQEDPFNGNFVEGLLNPSHGDDYGSLQIQKVNGNRLPAPLLVRCTPKLHYPFTAGGNWVFPSAQFIRSYVKLDGTNVFGFVYVDAHGKEYVSYKSRLSPFLADGRFGPFLSMWKEMRATYRSLDIEVRRFRGLSMELYGSRNRHLIHYSDALLDIAVLFCRHKDTILDPMQLSGLSLPTAKLVSEITKDYIYSYKQEQETFGWRLQRTEEGYFLGDEGTVWYLLDTMGTMHLFKCKPEQIEAIHWAAGGISEGSIRATVLNVLESQDDITFDAVIALLLEEYPQQDIEKAQLMIKRVINEEQGRAVLKADVLSTFSSLGSPWAPDTKRAVLRALSTHFPRSSMGKVYGVLAAEYGTV